MESERAAAASATPSPLPLAVERGAECFYGSPDACMSHRCGSPCERRFDRCHPCPACQQALVGDLREAVRELGGDPWEYAFQARMERNLRRMARSREAQEGSEA